MFFIMKRKKLVLDLFTHRQMIYDAAKLKSAAQFFPDWWKNLKTEMKSVNKDDLFPSATMRRCMGFVDNYKHGFIMPMWSDFRIELAPIGDPFFKAQMSDGTTHISQHPAMLRGSYLPETHYCHIKFSTPWAGRCKEDVYFKWEQPTWSLKSPDRVIVLPGVIEFKYQYSMNLNVMFARAKEKSMIQLDFQQPIVHLTPITEREVILKHHMVSREEYDKYMQGEKLSMINRYRAYRRVRESEEKKCPFGFGE